MFRIYIGKDFGVFVFGKVNEYIVNEFVRMSNRVSNYWSYWIGCIEMCNISRYFLIDIMLRLFYVFWCISGFRVYLN